MRKKILLGFLLLLTTTIGSIPAYSDNGVTDKDNDGCPDKFTNLIDTDRDGIPDSNDECPDVRETYNQYQDTDGCPDLVTSTSSLFSFPDSDGDGIEDRWDQCISERETFNNYLDWDGCPDVPGAESTGSPVDSDFDGIYDGED